MNLVHTISQLRRRWNAYRLQRSHFYRGDAVSLADAVFIIGCGRSGTTLLRAMLERHPRLWSGPESAAFVEAIDPWILSWQFGTDLGKTRALLATSSTAVEFADRYFGECARDAGKARWVEKTPSHVKCLPYLLTSFPNARFIQMIRDGRDVACSLRHHPKAAIRRSGVVPLQLNNPISKCIDRWVYDTSAGLAYQGHPRVKQVRYEQLVGDSETVLRDVCLFIGEEFMPSMLTAATAGSSTISAEQERAPSNLESFEAVNAASIGRWKRDLTAEELNLCMRRGGPLLEALGYTSTTRAAL
ncbi:MAG: sulfotransferase [Planctomycetota bacterium]|nr:MAG: sulfotransferase [Planctomycetota bacterium]